MTDSVAPLIEKICLRADVAERVARLPRPLVFTNGVFDVLCHEIKGLGMNIQLEKKTTDIDSLL